MTRDVLAMLRALVTKQGSQEKAAKAIGCSRVYLGEVLRGTRAPGPRILDYFEVARDVRYVDKRGTR